MLSSGAQQPAGSVHTCKHIIVTFLLSTTALIAIYFQTNTGRKVSVPASRLRVMAGMRVPSPRWVKVKGWQTKPKSAATSQQWLVTATDPVCSIKMSGPGAWQEGWGPGRQVWSGPDRGPPLSPPCWKNAILPVCDIKPVSIVLSRGGAEGVAMGGTVPLWVLLPESDSESKLACCSVNGLWNGPTRFRISGLKETQKDYKEAKENNFKDMQKDQKDTNNDHKETPNNHKYIQMDNLC